MKLSEVTTLADARAWVRAQLEVGSIPPDLGEVLYQSFPGEEDAIEQILAEEELRAELADVDASRARA